MNNVEEEVISLVSKILKIDHAKLHKDSSGDTIEQWDSLAHATIISCLEVHFDIKFDIMDMIEMRSIEDIVNTIQKYLK